MKIHKGDINLFGLHLTTLPDWMREIDLVDGWLDISYNQLESLDNLPKAVRYSLFAYNNAVKFDVEYVSGICKVGWIIYT